MVNKSFFFRLYINQLNDHKCRAITRYSSTINWLYWPNIFFFISFIKEGWSIYLNFFVWSKKNDSKPRYSNKTKMNFTWGQKWPGYRLCPVFVFFIKKNTLVFFCPIFVLTYVGHFLPYYRRIRVKQSACNGALFFHIYRWNSR